MITVSFEGGPGMTFVANIVEGVGMWSGVSVNADDANPSNGMLHLEQLSTSILDVSTAALTSVNATANEAEGETYLKLEVYNRSGVSITIRVTGGDIVELPAGQTGKITYQRTAPTILMEP